MKDSADPSSIHAGCFSNPVQNYWTVFIVKFVILNCEHYIIRYDPKKGLPIFSNVITVCFIEGKIVLSISVSASIDENTELLHKI